MIPSDHQIRADAEFLGFTDRDIDRILLHAQRARTGRTERDGYKSSHGAAGGRPSGISDPTGDMACDDDPITPEVEKQHTLLFDMLAQGATSKRAVRNTLERLNGVQAWVKPAGHTSTECCEPGCEDEAEKAGRCGADYMRKYRYEKDNPGQTCPPLAAEELAKRNPPKRMKAS